MDRRSPAFAALAALAIVVLGPLTCAAAEPDVRIPFANYGGINDWRADGSSAIYIQGRNRSWYHAELLGSCTDLPFAEHVGFVVEPNGEFDRFSEIIVGHQRCILKSLTKSEPPPTKAKTKGKTVPTPPTPQASK